MNSDLARYDSFGRRAIHIGFLAAVLALLLFPLLVMLSTALKTSQEVSSYPPSLVPAQLAPGNFLDVWGYVPLAQYFVNSFLVAGGAMLLNAVAAVPAGFALARLRFPGRTPILITVIATQMFTPMILLIASFQLMTTLHIVNTLWSLVLLERDGDASVHYLDDDSIFLDHSR